MKIIKLLLIAASLVLCLAIYVACGNSGESVDPNADGNPTEENGSAETEQKLHLSLKAIPSLDPQRYTASTAYAAYKAVGEGLVRVHSGTIQPGVAESWETAEDKLSITFHLREDACWSDGTPLTAEDFVYAFRRLVDPANGFTYNWVLYDVENYGKIVTGDLTPEDLGVEATDAHTLVIRFRTPSPYYLSYLDRPPLYPVKQSVVEQHGENFGTSAETLLTNGPFQVTYYAAEEQLVMEPNPNYWDKDSIHLEEVTITITDEETAFAMFEAGSLDYANIPIATAANYLQNTASLPADTSTASYMNGTVDWFAINMTRRGSELANQDFRLALNYALDREACIAATSGGLHAPATRMVLPKVSGLTGYYADDYPIDIYQSTADLEKAQEHLAAALKTLRKEAAEISLTITMAETASRLLAESCQQQWQDALGITVEIITVTSAELQEKRESGDFDLLLTNTTPLRNDPYTYLSVFISDSPQNGGGYESSNFDKKLSQALEEADPETRFTAYAEAETMLLENAACIPVQFRNVPWVKRDNLQGLIRFFLGCEDDFIYAYFE